jgi:ATP-dependent DNA helicase DinG
MQVKQIYTKLTDSMPNCKVRNSQLQMVQLLDACFGSENLKACADADKNIDDNEDDDFIQNENKITDGSNICIIEAPTGTGKSLAYLLAGVINAKKMGKKLIISTATKTLQNQLVEKDIPNFIKHSGIKFTYGLAKGRSNYLCPHQLELSTQAINVNSSMDMFNEAEIAGNKEILLDLTTAYLKNKWDGDLDAAPIPLNYKIKSSIITDKDRCLGSLCEYNERDDCHCPYYINRGDLKSCVVIVTNHSLLLADIAFGGRVLPVRPNDYILCIDEGHTLADYAINSFTESFELKHAANDCQALAKLIYNPHTLYICDDKVLCEKLSSQAINLGEQLDELILSLMQNLDLFAVDRKLILNDYLNPVAASFRDYFVNFAFIGAELSAGLLKLQDKLKEVLKKGQDYTIEASISKLGFFTTLIKSITTTSQYIINQDDSRYNANAKWIELRLIKSTEEFIISASLTHVGNVLLNKLWSQVFAAVITSATLAVGSDFKYYLHKLGLNLYPNIACAKLATEFSYPEQGQIVVPKFKNTPEYATRDLFTQELVTYFEDTLNYTDGYGTLVLFFNRSQLQECHSLLPKDLQKKILCQTDFISNQRLIEEHKKIINSGLPSIIFGLNSFAEGVDLPSLYCMHVIITKLPFETHKDPLNMVQEYWLKFEKSNYFIEVALPETCIKLVQAVGRLIRSESDYGQVSICDNRLIHKQYGLMLLNSLPAFNRKYNSEFIKNSYTQVLNSSNISKSSNQINRIGK